MPENDDDVLIYNYRDGICVGFFEADNVSGYIENDGSFFKMDDGWEDGYAWARHMSPTHWMPLPKPPEKENQEISMITEWGGSLNCIVNGEIRNMAEVMNEIERNNESSK